MIKTINILDDNVLNIFCDASITKVGERTFGMPGSVVVDSKGNAIDYTNQLMVDSTNNESEIYAILLATWQCIKYKDSCSRINIFSDSKISVCGLREWMFNWIKRSSDGVLMSTSGVVANQQIFLHIVNLVINYLDSYNLYHVDGHKNPNNPLDMLKFIDDFKKFNNIYINPSEAVYLSTNNNWVDNETRLDLEITDIERYPKLINGIIYSIPNKDETNIFRGILDI